MLNESMATEVDPTDLAVEAPEQTDATTDPLQDELERERALLLARLRHRDAQRRIVVSQSIAQRCRLV